MARQGFGGRVGKRGAGRQRAHAFVRALLSPLIVSGLVVFGLVVLGLASAGHAATHVLLAGVSRYDHLPPEKQLSAPGQDVIRMRDALAGWGVKPGDMTLLADGVDGAHGRPTRAALMAALERMGRPGVVAAGDWVVIYLSGHGATASDGAGVQMSGLNSLFLPADARLMSGAAPQNAIYDTEIGAALGRIRARGAHVWFINDSCHSGDSVRAEVQPDVRDKSVSPPIRRKPGAARPKPLPAAPPPATGPAPASGRLVAFYAAQVTEAARELKLDGVWASAFTLSLTRAMSQSPARDARSLASRTILGVRALRPNGIFQTPYADDDLADGLPLLGEGNGPGPRGADENDQRRAEGTGQTLLAGVLDGFETGSEIAVFAHAAADQPIARARVEEGGLSRSRIVAIEGTLPAAGWFATLVTPAPERRLTIAADPDAPAADAARLASLIRNAGAASGFAAVQTAEADVLLGTADGRLRMVPKRALAGVVEAVTLPAAPVAQPDAALRTALLRLDLIRRIEQAEAMAAHVPGLMRAQLRTSFRRFAGSTAGASCAAPRGDAEGASFTASTPVARCDAIEVEIRNQGDKPRHIQVLAIHNDGTVQTIAPRCGAGAGLKLEPGQATAARARASAISALPVVWFLVPRPRLPGPGRMALKVIAFPIDAATTAPDPCQFERFNGAAPVSTRGALAFEQDARSGAARPGEILMQTRILEWPAP